MRRLLAVGIVLAALVPRVHGAGASPAVDVVEGLHRVLAQNMAADGERDPALRAERLAPVVAAAFDFEAISRAALGSAHDTLDADARARFRELMQRLSTLTYAQRFAPSESGPRFVTVEERPARRARTLVRTRLERDDGAPVQLDYVLHHTAAGPRIVNVLADGVSDLSLKRAEYSAVIRKEGVDALFRRIADQVGTLARGVAAGS